MMKPCLFFVVVLVASIIIASCAPSVTEAPNMFDYPTASGLTPANLDVVIGTSEPVIAVSNNWTSYQNDEIGISLNYPPSWRAITLSDASGVGLYPPKSDPNFPTPMIRIEWLNVPYLSNQPLVKTGSPINSIEVSGTIGRQYQDSKFALPTQSYYIEIPYHDGTLFFITTEGPSVDLTPQLSEILKTLAFLNSTTDFENPDTLQDWQNTQNQGVPKSSSGGGFGLVLILVLLVVGGVSIPVIRSRARKKVPYSGVPAQAILVGADGLRMDITLTEFIIGRSSSCSLRLNDPAVSRKHAHIRYAQGQWFIQDLGSGVGTYVNGTPIQAAMLKNGDCIRIGSNEFEFRT